MQGKREKVIGITLPRTSLTFEETYLSTIHGNGKENKFKEDVYLMTKYVTKAKEIVDLKQKCQLRMLKDFGCQS